MWRHCYNEKLLYTYMNNMTNRQRKREKRERRRRRDVLSVKSMGDIYFWVCVYVCWHGCPKANEEQADRWMTVFMISFGFLRCRGDTESTDFSPSLSPFFSHLSHLGLVPALSMRMWVSLCLPEAGSRCTAVYSHL